MKNLIGNIPNYVNKKITFSLLDRYENLAYGITEDGEYHSLVETTTDANGNFSVSLESLDRFRFDMTYKMSFEDNRPSLKLYVYGSNQEPVDYKKFLIKQPNLSTFYEYVEKNGDYIFVLEIEKIFEIFFAGENDFFKQHEHNLVETYIKYADDKIESEAMKELDKYLATIGV